VFLLAGLGCARVDDGRVPVDPTREAKGVVAQVLRDFEKAELAEDAEAVASLFTQDMGQSVMEEVYAGETVVGVEIVTHGTVILGEWAVTWGTDSIDVVDADGERFTAKDDHVIVFHNGGDGWKISRFINSLGVLPRGFLLELEKVVSENPHG
jgi:ketosteroid isomerase-like protein